MKPIRVMIVEDERIIALDLQHQLKNMNYQVCQIVSSGALAIQSANDTRPDIILMDIHLEGSMDGIDAACEIQKRFKIPIIFLTAYAEDATLKRAEAALPYGYLVKPISPRELNATLQMAAVRHMSTLYTENNADRFRQALEAALLNVWEWDTSTDTINIYNLISSSQTAQFSPICESLNKFYNRVDTRDLNKVRENIEKARNEGGSINVSFRTRSFAGKTRWIEVHAKRFDDKDNVSGKILGVVQDVTERRRDAEYLRQASVVFKSTSDGILILDNKLKIISANPAVLQLTGYDPDEMISWPSIDQLYAQKHSAHFFDKISETEKGQWQGNIRYCRKDQKIVAVWENISIVRDADKNVSNYIIVFSDIGAIIDMQDKLEFLSKHDSLTSLCNRRMFLDRLEIEVDKCSRNNYLVAIMLIDLDHFKTINDSIGHPAGDNLLKEASTRLISCVRASDTVARLGGDEFTIILSELESVTTVDHIALNILKKLSEPFNLEGKMCYLSGSIGIAIAPTDGTEVSELIKNADQAMYSAKHSGRNCYSYFEQSMQKASEERLKISNSLHEALSLQQFRVVYQPIIELSTGRVHKAESLIRWTHPVHGEVGPAIFIPIAEENGLIQKISDWVFEQVKQQLPRWRNSFHPDFQISINISPMQFRNQHKHWLDEMQTIGLPGNSLAIEITEGFLLDNNPLVMKCLQDFHEYGIKISLDDFGTGYSSLAYLKKFDIDFLKIDQSFVRNLTQESDDLVLCEAIIVMAHKLGIEVIAEGIETEAQAQLLTRAGCDYGQGYFFSRPVPAREFSDFLEEQRI